MASPNTTVDADVTAIPINEYSTIATGSPIACATICDSCFFAYRVKSGIFKLSVAQYPTIAVSDGKKNFRNPCVVVNLLGVESIGPNPPARCSMNPSSASPSTSISGAEKLCRNRIDSTPRHTTTIFSAQNPRKQTHVTLGRCAAAGHSTATIAAIACPP